MCQRRAPRADVFKIAQGFPRERVKSRMTRAERKCQVGRGVMARMETFTLVPRGPFSLAASIRFLEGFTPASYRGRRG